jgi:germination protein, Ger(x)C family
MRKKSLKSYGKVLLVTIALVLFSALLSGCWDAMDIDDKLIATAIALDYKDGEIWYYVEYANIEAQKSQEGASINAKATYVKGYGADLNEMRENLDRQIDKPMYLSGVRTVIFTESFANKYMVEYLYRFRADENYRKKIETVITKEDPEEIFITTHENNASVGFFVEDMIDTLDHAGLSVSRTTMRLIENLSSNYSGILMFTIGLQNKEIALTGYSVVDGDKVTGFIPVEESKGVVFLKADKPKFNYTVSYNDIGFTMEVDLTKRKITPSYENGEVSFDVEFNFNAKLMYGDQKTPYNFEDAAIREVTRLLQGMLLKDISDALTLGQKEFKCDYFQFDDEFRVHYPVAFESMDWQKEFTGAAVRIAVTVDLSTTYMMDYGDVDVK